MQPQQRLAKPTEVELIHCLRNWGRTCSSKPAAAQHVESLAAGSTRHCRKGLLKCLGQVLLVDGPHVGVTCH